MQTSTGGRNADPPRYPNAAMFRLFARTPRLSRTRQGVLTTQRSAPADCRPDLSAQFFLADADAEVASRYADIANRYLGHDSHQDN
jgi:hypothetical protein